jgi:hypothetical protein
MTDIEQSILDSLQEMDSAVKEMSNGNAKRNLVPIFERIDALARQLPTDTHRDLRHYLARKSYEKARVLLEGQGHANPRGTCG